MLSEDLPLNHPIYDPRGIECSDINAPLFVRFTDGDISEKAEWIINRVPEALRHLQIPTLPRIILCSEADWLDLRKHDFVPEATQGARMGHRQRYEMMLPLSDL